MKKTVFIFLFSFCIFRLFAIQPEVETKPFWKEDFSAGVIPAGWQNVALNDSNVVWKVTDQPFPGSYGRNYQAPPIASKSRGYHLQIDPGVKVNRNIKNWKTAGISPDAYIQTPTIDCSKKKSVVLKFQQNFFWDKWEQDTKKSGLIVAVSNDGKIWKEYDVHNGIEPGDDCPNPMNVELNITHEAAGQKTVYIRFFWQHMYRWYWMIDDIELSEALDLDVQALRITSHKEEGNTFTKNDTLAFDIVNMSARPITDRFDCYLQIDKRPVQKTTVEASAKKPFGIIDTIKISFPGIDLSDVGVHKVLFYTTLPGDLRTSNDTLSMELYSEACKIGAITGITKNGNEVELNCNFTKFKIQFLRNDIFRIWMAYNGEFTNPAGNDIAIHAPIHQPEVNMENRGDYYLINTDSIALRVYKNPLRFALYKTGNTALIWEETQGITYGKQTVQYLKRGDNEQFFGGGMQNGRFSHRDKTIKMTIDYNWEDGGNPNPATFYMSTAGYGAMRNTYSTGEYAFQDTVQLIQNESRFDCYYFTGNSLKDILNDYTDITGKPFLIPRWGLSMGDANCYNRGAKAGTTIGSTSTGFDGLTPSVIHLIADEYIKHDMPRGWILPNDGYGCGYTDLKYVVDELLKRGFHTGLWTENGVEKIAREVGEYGSRLCKLDVAWVGPGFKYALDGAKAAFEGIENNSNARGFVWMVCGWTGSQRNAVLWTGDQSGTWDYIRWHIPTVVGCGLSAQNYATGDVDGIFGGSDSTYVRDLQWKCFTPAFMGMSGWASNNKNGIKDKQPWLFGEPFTSINRKYLMLKQRLTPYMYTLCHEAYRTGTPAVRGLVLEYPNDPVTWGDEVKYEFLLGKDLLVAPVYTPASQRDSIYLPAGKWIDYWDGAEYDGNTTLTNYSAPLDKLPLFVRSGAIIPMYQQMRYDGQFPVDTLTLDIYPDGNSSFVMYEDDGNTREYKKGKFAATKFEVKTFKKEMNIVLNAALGDFTGRMTQRAYCLDIHTKIRPKEILLQGQKMKRQKNKADFESASSGWYYETGILHIKTSYISTNVNTIIKIE
jgi:alpha-glucosidase (family GH31 glycosyl hydrolase)